MKNFKRYLSFVAVFAMLFTSCSKEETGLNPDSEKATLSFGAIVNDLVNNRAADKQAVGDIPDCTEDTPTYVEIVLMQGDDFVVGSAEEPYRVNLVSGQVFTEEDENLELTPGNYSLSHFSVYNAEDELIWIAPRVGSDLAGFVETTLPLAIDLRAGVKKYVDVPVLCFDNRDVNQYGYLFFELNPTIAIQYCFFANYCNDDGRHFPASYTVSVWAGTSSEGTLLYDNVSNFTGQYSNGDYYATPLCIALPDNEDEDEDYLYYEVTLQDWDALYGDVDQTVRTGILSKQDIMDTWVGDDGSNFNHLRFNCGGSDPVDSDGDGIPDSEDECPNQAGPASNNGCPVTAPVDSDGDGIPDSEDECPNEAGPESNNGCPVTTPVDSDGDGIPDSEDECPNEAGPASNNGCPVTTPVDSDGDGIPDSEDECPNEAGPASNNGCPVADTCVINAPDSGCEVAFLEGSDTFLSIVDPEGSPEFLALIDSNGEAVGSVTATLNESNDPVIIVNMGFGYSVTDYRIEVSQSANGSNSSCVVENNYTPPTGDDPDIFEIFDQTSDYSYPFYVKITANSCSTE